MIKVVMTSDLHGARPTIPRCDLLLICGDVTARDTIVQRRLFTEWLADAPATDKVVIAGNHDSDAMYDVSEQTDTAHYLLNSGVNVQGLKIWGSPYSVPFMHWNFMPDDSVRRHAYAQMPDKFDILMTHGPEYGVLDRNKDGEWCGDQILASALSVKHPYMHVFGHIHEGFGYSHITGLHSYNVSYVDYRYQYINGIVEIRLDKNNKLM